jgi:hypothetical protein
MHSMASARAAARALLPQLAGGATLAAMALCAALPATAAPPTMRNIYTFRDIINNNDVTFNQELGINTQGAIAGYFGSGAAGHPNKGYTVVQPYGQVEFSNENFPRSVQTQVTGLNNRGIWTRYFQYLGTTVGFWSDSNNVSEVNNNFGFINVGGQYGAFVNVNNPATGVINGVVTNQLLGVNDFNVAVGFYIDTSALTHGYTYTLQTNTFSPNIDDPNGVGATTAAAINNHGQIVGFFTNSSTGVVQGFFDNHGVFTTIVAPNSTSTMLLGLNNFGEAVGVDMDTSGLMHGIVCNVLSGACLVTDDPKGRGTTTFNGVNDLGQVVGFYVNGAGNTIGLLATPILYPLTTTPRVAMQP